MRLPCQMMAKFGKFFNPTNVLSFGKRIASTTFTEIRFLGQTLSQLLFKADALAVAGFEFRGITRPLLGSELDDLVPKFKAKPSTLGEKLEHSIKKPNGDLLIDTEEGYLLMQTINEGNQKGIGFFKKTIKNGKAIRQLVGYLAVAATTEQMLVPNSPVEIEDEPDEDCPVCNKAYWPCLVYKAATYSGKKAALDKLCTLNPTKKDAICQELYGYEIREINAFLEDLLSNLGNADALGNHVSSIDVALVRGWKKMNTHKSTGYTKDYPAILKLISLLADNTFVSRVGGEAGLGEILEKNRRLPCNTCDNSKAKMYLRKMHEYLDDVEDFVSRYHGRSGFSEVMGGSGVKSNLVYTVEGAAFMLRVLNNDAALGIEINGFEVKYNQNDEDESNNREADIEKRIINTTNEVLIECKSWAANGKGFLKFVEGKGSYGQFKDYLSRIPRINGIEYWFDKEKITETQAKGKFKEMLQNATLQTEIFNTIWGNVGLRGDLFPETVGKIPQWLIDNKNRIKGEFAEQISDASDDFYNFIKVK